MRWIELAIAREELKNDVFKLFRAVLKELQMKNFSLVQQWFDLYKPNLFGKLTTIPVLRNHNFEDLEDSIIIFWLGQN